MDSFDLCTVTRFVVFVYFSKLRVLPVHSVNDNHGKLSSLLTLCFFGSLKGSTCWLHRPGSKLGSLVCRSWYLKYRRGHNLHDVKELKTIRLDRRGVETLGSRNQQRHGEGPTSRNDVFRFLPSWCHKTNEGDPGEHSPNRTTTTLEVMYGCFSRGFRVTRERAGGRRRWVDTLL